MSVWIWEIFWIWSATLSLRTRWNFSVILQIHYLIPMIKDGRILAAIFNRVFEFFPVKPVQNNFEYPYRSWFYCHLEKVPLLSVWYVFFVNVHAVQSDTDMASQPTGVLPPPSLVFFLLSEVITSKHYPSYPKAVFLF